MRPRLHLPSFERALVAALLLLSSSCASILTTWHDRAYTEVVPTDDTLVLTSDTPRDVEEVPDLAEASDALYAEGYVLLGFTKFTHTLVPGFQRRYAKLYAGRIGAERTVQATPQRDGGVYAYTVTYWSRAADFPLGAYFNDVPDSTALVFPDALRERLAPGHRPVVVEAVVRGSAAERAGVERGELIVAVDGRSFPGSEGLDALLPERANDEVVLTVWGLDGARDATCRIGARVTGAAGHGPEGLYFNRPWAFVEHRNFQRYSEAFTRGFRSAIEAQRAAQERAWRDARIASLTSRTDHLQNRINELESQPSVRDSRPAGWIDRDRLREQGAKNWESFKDRMDWQ
ncbi:MAG: PDZ domain-containing protein [Planctomycetota bacterium]